MLIFIDDSGDPAFSLTKGSSSVFVICLVIFDDPLVAEETAVALKKLRRELGFPDSMEFKFHKSKLAVKRRFLEVSTKFPFRVRAIVMKKDKIRSKFLRENVDSFYNYTIMQVLKHNNGTIKHAKLKFDKRGEKRIRNELRAYLSRELDNASNDVFVDLKFVDLKFVDSKENILIQLAAMTAGCIAQYYKGEDKGLFAHLLKRKEDIWEYS